MHALNPLLDQGVEVLTSSRRLAHALRIAYGAHAQSSGRTVWRTPTVIPFTTWLRTRWLDARAEVDSHAPAVLLTRAQTQLIWDQVVAASPLAQDLLNAGEAARSAARSYDVLRQYLIDPRQLELFDTPEANALLRWSSEYARRCALLGAIDETELLQWAWSSNFMPQQRIALAGFDHLTPAMARLVERWSTQGRVEPMDTAAATNDVATVGMYDREAEVEAAARWARRQIELGSTRIAVIADDIQARRDEFQRVFQAIFAPNQRTMTPDAAHPPFVIAAAQPLANYPMVDAALRLLDLLRGHADAVLVGRVLRTPFFRGGVNERDARALSDAQLRAMQRAEWDVFELERWAGITHCPQLELAMREAARWQRATPARGLPSAWSERILAVLQSVGWPGERSLDSVEQQTFVKFQSALAELARFDVVLGSITFAQAHHEVRRLLQETLFEPETPPALVTVIDSTTVAGMSFAHAWMMGLDAARFPAPSAPDPLIPLPLQKAAALPTATAELSFQYSQRRLERVLSSSAHVVLSWPMHDGDAGLQRSPMLDVFPAKQPHELELSNIREYGHTVFNARPALLVMEDDRAPALLARSARGGARILELQSLCPFRAQATLRLRAEPLQRIAPGLQASDRGRLLHRVLESLWRELGSQERLLQLSEEQLEVRLRALAQEHATRLLSAQTPMRARLMHLEVEALVRQVLRLTAIDRVRPAFSVPLTERDESFTVGGLSMRIQPDRVDHVDGGAFLIDYKLGERYAPRDWLDRRPGRPTQPQLPLYAIVHAHELAGLAFATLAPGAVEYRGWSDGTSIAPGVSEYPAALKKKMFAPPDWTALVEHWQMTLNHLAANYVAGQSTVDPLPEACTYCHLSTFCRVNEAVPADASESDVDE